jgi:hypothetical protein
MVAVNSVLGASPLVGTSVAVVRLYVTVAGMTVVPFLSSNVVEFRVEDVIVWLNVAVTEALRGMPFAAAAGTVEVTVGATLAGGAVGEPSPHPVARTSADVSRIAEYFMCTVSRTADILMWVSSVHCATGSCPRSHSRGIGHRDEKGARPPARTD